MEKVERTQYQAALAGTWQGSNRSKFYEELGWETLSDRRWCRRILQIHKIKNNMTPSYLSTVYFCIDVIIEIWALITLTYFISCCMYNVYSVILF